MRSWLFSAVAIAGVLAGSSSRLEAKPSSRIAVLSLEISGDGPPELRKQLQSQIAEGLASAGAEVTSLDSTLELLKSAPELIGCSSTACLERIGEITSARRFVRAVVVASGANYEVRLELLQASEDKPVLNSVDASCAVCTIVELNERMTEAAAKLLDGKTSGTVRVRLASDPPGAALWVDGSEVGTSPMDFELSPGVHTIEARLAEHASSEKQIEVQAGSESEQRFELVLPPTLEATETSSYGMVKWGAAGGSAALLILGASLLAIDGNPTCSGDGATCARLRSTKVPGILSLTGGVVLGGVAGWMFWKDASAAGDEGLTLDIGRNHASGGYRVRF